MKHDRLKTEDSTNILPNPAHIDAMIELLGMDEAKSLPTPDLAERARQDGDDQPLDDAAMGTFRSGVGVAL